MLKTIIFATGTLLVASLIASTPADASPHRSYRAHGIAAAQRLRPRVRLARAHRPGVRAYAGVAFHPGHMRLSRLRRTRHGLVLAHRGYGRHRQRFAARRDNAILPDVGAASPLARVAAPASSGAQVGGASYYGGGRTASGSRVGAATCAHRSLPFGTRVLVTNLNNARSAVLTVNDRGPFVRGRIVDVSVGAAGMLGMLHSGTARVSVQVIGGPG